MAYDTINDAVTIPGKGEGAIRRSRGTRDPTWRPRRGAALPLRRQDGGSTCQCAN